MLRNRVTESETAKTANRENANYHALKRNRVTKAKPSKTPVQTHQKGGAVTSFGFAYYPYEKRESEVLKVQEIGEKCHLVTSLMKRVLTAATVALLCAVTITGCAIGSATATQVDDPRPDFARVRDLYFAERDPSGATRIVAEQAEREAAEHAEREAAEAAAAAEVEWEAENHYAEPYVASQPAAIQGNPNGLNTQDGIFEYDGHVETYYSTRAVYDDGLTVDEQGFYRTQDGYYVVASSEHAEGEHVQISQGEAVVMDSGPEAGVIDVHTAW